MKIYKVHSEHCFRDCFRHFPWKSSWHFTSNSLQKFHKKNKKSYISWFGISLNSQVIHPDFLKEFNQGKAQEYIQRFLPGVILKFKKILQKFLVKSPLLLFCSDESIKSTRTSSRNFSKNSWSNFWMQSDSNQTFIYKFRQKFL